MKIQGKSHWKIAVFGISQFVQPQFILGSDSSGRGQLKGNEFCAVRGDEVYVVDRDNHRVVVVANEGAACPIVKLLAVVSCPKHSVSSGRRGSLNVDREGRNGLSLGATVRVGWGAAERFPQ